MDSRQLVVLVKRSFRALHGKLDFASKRKASAESDEVIIGPGPSVARREASKLIVIRRSWLC